jgi:hypothetical protein
MRLEIRQMQEEEAQEIATWRYEPPYPFLEMTRSA